MKRWAGVAIPLMFCVVLMDAAVRQFWADRASQKAKDRIAKYEAEYALFLKGERPRPSLSARWGDALEKAVQLQPASAEYRNYLGRFYQALAANPSLSEEERLKLTGKAIEQHQEAVKLDPLNGVYLAYLAWLEGVTGRHTWAIEHFDKAVELNRSNKWIQQMRGAYLELTFFPEGDTELPGSDEPSPG